MHVYTLAFFIQRLVSTFKTAYGKQNEYIMLQIPEKGPTAKKKQKKESPLSCVICKSSFNTLEEMKEHVRNPCSKPPVTKPEEPVPANPELVHFEQQLQQLQDAKGEDIATNQIESLLRAAQALHQQQQEQQRQQQEQLQSEFMFGFFYHR